MNTASPRWRRAKADTQSLRSLKLDVARVVVTGALTVLIIAVVGVPSGNPEGELVSVAILVGSGVFVLAVEFGVNWVLADARLAHDENERLRSENKELRENQEDVAAVRRLQEQQAAIYREHEAQLRKTINVQEAQFKVFRDIAVEEQRTGRKVPFEAMMARLDVSTKVATGDFGEK